MAARRRSGRRGAARHDGRGPRNEAGHDRGPGARRHPKKRAVKVTPLPPQPVESDGLIRLNRLLAASGICSRRAADDMILAGRVTIDGEVVTELGTRVDPVEHEVRFDGDRLKTEKPVHLLFNKPRGVVCTNARNEQRKRVIDYLPSVRGRLYTVGRLDADSEGLILVTNDGDFAQKLTHPRYGIAKTYAVLVRGRVDTDDVDKARGGVWLSEGKTGGAKITVERRGRDRTYLKVSIREGRNREIRRVFSRLGYPVLSLKRVRIGRLNLHGLGSGRYRFLTRDEVTHLKGLASEDAF